MNVRLKWELRLKPSRQLIVKDWRVEKAETIPAERAETIPAERVVFKSSRVEKDETIPAERVVLTGGPRVSRELEGCEGLRARKQNPPL